MEVVFKTEQVNQISAKLNIPKVTVEKVLTDYITYLRERLDAGETVKFLNVCYLRRQKTGVDDTLHETIAYTATEIANRVKVSNVVVLRIFQEYEENLIKDLKKSFSYSIRGLIRIRLERNYKGEYKVRTKKSTVYNGTDVYVTTPGYFKRKAEIVA